MAGRANKVLGSGALRALLFLVVLSGVGAQGVVTTLAGSGTGTLVDGTGTGASFFYPRGVAIDSGGNIIVADTQNNRIRKITNPGGVVTTLAGRGESGSQSMNQGEDTFSLPMGVAVDSNDNIIVADTNRNCLRFLQFP